MIQRLTGLGCIAVLCVILSLGLWPFDIPENDVTWLADTNGRRFVKFGTVFSSGEVLPAATENQPIGTVEVWLQPGRIWEFGTFLDFYTPDDPSASRYTNGKLACCRGLRRIFTSTISSPERGQHSLRLQQAGREPLSTSTARWQRRRQRFNFPQTHSLAG